MKARRLLAEGRLTVERVERPSDRNPTWASGTLIIARCRGDSGAVYSLGYDPGAKEWRCTCPAKGRCAHLTALMLVTVAA